MRRWVAVLALFLTVSFLDLWPFRELDTGELYIVETLVIETDEQVRLRAGEFSGTGETVEAAAADLESRVPGSLFLRQTDRVILCGGAEDRCDLRALSELLPMGACLYHCRELPEDLETMERVLRTRERREENAPTLA